MFRCLQRVGENFFQDQGVFGHVFFRVERGIVGWVEEREAGRFDVVLEDEELRDLLFANFFKLGKPFLLLHHLKVAPYAVALLDLLTVR